MASISEHNSNKTGGTLRTLAEIGRLVVMLLCKIIICLLLMIKKILILLWDFTKWICFSIQTFWNSNDTQAKIAKIKALSRAGAIWMWAKICIGAKILWHHIVYLGPIMRKAWLKMVERTRRGYRTFQVFRKRKGFRGILIECRDWLKKIVYNYIDDESGSQSEAGAITESGGESDEDDADDESDNKAMEIGRKIISPFQDLMDESKSRRQHR